MELSIQNQKIELIQWTEREMRNLSNEIERTLSLISKNPELFQKSKVNNGVRRAVIMKYNSLYYRKNNDIIEVLSFFQIVKTQRN